MKNLSPSLNACENSSTPCERKEEEEEEEEDEEEEEEEEELETCACCGRGRPSVRQTRNQKKSRDSVSRKRKGREGGREGGPERSHSNLLPVGRDPLAPRISITYGPKINSGVKGFYAMCGGGEKRPEAAGDGRRDSHSAYCINTDHNFFEVCVCLQRNILPQDKRN